MNKKSLLWTWSINIFLIVVSGLCIMPFVLLFMSSFTDEQVILQHGYSFFPEKISFSAYAYLWRIASDIIRALGITILVTFIGTAVSLLINALLSYPLSRKDLPMRNGLSFLIFFTMLFNGGLVPTYLLYTQVIELKNTLFAFIIPGLLLSGFFVILMRTFFTESIPTPVIESAEIDGAGEFKIFYSIVLPLSLPVLATVGMFQTLNYWNDWFNGLIYITDPKLFSLQTMLNRILLDIQFLASGGGMWNSTQATPTIPMAGVRMALGVIGIVPILIVYPFFQKYFVKGLTIGAVKG